VLVAQQKQVTNFSLLAGNKVVPPALHALLAQPELGIDALLLPGHVSAVIGTEPYKFIPRDYGIPCVVAGFEPGDIVIAVKELLDMIRDNRCEVKNCYERVVRDCGNEKARTVMDTVFEPVDDTWRGFGLIASSGLGLRPEYSEFDVCAKLGMSVPDGHDPPGCRCGDVVRGLIDPNECGLFGTVCTPDQPVGPCMVSSEGTCAAHFKYGSGTV
ncbi:MAG: hydrogenase formation protein HypD, partial [Candidatus Hydrogenedentes bacterium]|nr:hydrogenase formation protein HypD [Candidatus Hydrogenedentota bacterium]